MESEADAVGSTAQMSLMEYARWLVAQDRLFRNTFRREIEDVVAAAEDRPMDAFCQTNLYREASLHCELSERLTGRLESSLTNPPDESFVDLCGQLLKVWLARGALGTIFLWGWGTWPLAAPGQRLWSATDQLAGIVRATLDIQPPQELEQYREWGEYCANANRLIDGATDMWRAKQTPGLLDLDVLPPLLSIMVSTSSANSMRGVQQEWWEIATSISWILKQCERDIPRWEEKITDLPQVRWEASYLEDWESLLWETIEAVEVIGKVCKHLTMALAAAPAGLRKELPVAPPDSAHLVQQLEYLIACCRDGGTEPPLERARLQGESMETEEHPPQEQQS